MDIDLTEHDEDLEELADGLKERFALRLSIAELKSAGYQALYEEAQAGRFDPARGTFWAYAYKSVSGAMLLEARFSPGGGRSRRWQAALKAHHEAIVTARPHDDGFRAIAEHFERRLELYSAELETPEARTLADDERERLKARVERLPEPHRTMMLQHCYEGLTLKEVGDRAGLSESQASRAITEVKQFLQNVFRPAT